LSLQNWRAQTQLVDSLAKQFEAELAETKKQIASVNLERKLQQTAAGEVMVVVGGIKPDQADLITLSA
jgi:ribosomal protein L18E